MSSKSGKKAVGTPQDRVASSSGGSQRTGSPLSPTRISRIQEKEELQNLNDRLANYIDRVRNLEADNRVLQTQIRTSEEHITKEVSGLKGMYDVELANARKLLDETAKEKSKFQLEYNKYKTENDELTTRLAKRDKDIAALEKQNNVLEPKVQDLQGRLNSAVAEKKRAEEEAKELRAELDKANKTLAQVRKDLEDLTLKNVDAQNRCLSLTEELQFKNQIYEQEVTEIRTRKHVEVSELDQQLHTQYEQKLLESLQDLRDQYDNQMRQNRDELESIYETKLEDMQRFGDMNSSNANNTREELRTTKTRLDTLTAKIGEVEAQNSLLTSRIRDLETQLDNERTNHVLEMSRREEQLRDLQNNMAAHLREYQDLMDVKVALDMEIAAYRKLLEGEESRLNLGPIKSPRESSQRGTPRRTPLRALKRKRGPGGLMSVAESSSSRFISSGTTKGDVAISEQDVEGKFIKVQNKGEKDVTVGGWQLIRRVNDQEVVYKFHRSVVLKVGQTTTVWSSDAENVVHSPPTELLMKNQQWLKGDHVNTTLVNSSGEEMATLESKRDITRSLFTEEFQGEHLYHQQGDPQQSDRCSIM